MSLWNVLKGFFCGSGCASNGDAAKEVYVIDATRMADPNVSPDRVSPREQFLMLQRIASFAGREEVQAVAILAGRPLREAGEGEVYQGVKVFYAERSEQLAGVVVQAVKNQRSVRKVVVFTGEPSVEEAVKEVGALVMSVSTLRKAMDEAGGGGGGRRRQRDRQSPRGDRPSRRGRSGNGNANRSRRTQKPKADAEQPPAESQKPQSKSADGVSDLIDLV